MIQPQPTTFLLLLTAERQQQLVRREVPAGPLAHALAWWRRGASAREQASEAAAPVSLTVNETTETQAVARAAHDGQSSRSRVRRSLAGGVARARRRRRGARAVGVRRQVHTADRRQDCGGL